MPAVRAVVAQTFRYTCTRSTPRDARRCASRVYLFMVGSMLLGCLGVCGIAVAQNPAPPSQTQAAQRQNAPPAPPIAPVTTTVVVHGEVKDDYLPEVVGVGTLDGASLLETPLSATVVRSE